MGVNFGVFGLVLAYSAFGALWLLKTPVDLVHWLLSRLDIWLDKQLAKVLGVD